jgi:hypothetical protein
MRRQSRNGLPIASTALDVYTAILRSKTRHTHALTLPVGQPLRDMLDASRISRTTGTRSRRRRTTPHDVRLAQEDQLPAANFHLVALGSFADASQTRIHTTYR